MKTHRIFCLGVLCIALTAFGNESPKLSEVKTFKIYFKEGFGFTLKDGELEEQTTDKKLSTNGEIVFSITGEGKGLMIGTVGSTEVTIIHRPNSLIFVELPPQGSMQVLTVFKTWNKKAGGFVCVYDRCVNLSGLADIQVVSTFYGVAKPFD